jgi:hypothetical protein
VKFHRAPIDAAEVTVAVDVGAPDSVVVKILSAIDGPGVGLLCIWVAAATTVAGMVRRDERRAEASAGVIVVVVLNAVNVRADVSEAQSVEAVAAADDDLWR